MVRTVDEITEDNIIVQQMDKQIQQNGDGEDTLMIRVLRKNFISSEQGTCDLGFACLTRGHGHREIVETAFGGADSA